MSCEYDDNAVNSELSLQILLAKGPAWHEEALSLPYFIAIVDRNDRVLDKRVFNSKVGFPEGRRRATIVDTLEQRIPISGQETGDRYRIMVGFQLTRAQLQDQLKREH